MPEPLPVSPVRTWRFPPLEEVRIPGEPRNESAVELANPEDISAVRHWALGIGHWVEGLVNNISPIPCFLFPLSLSRYRIHSFFPCFRQNKSGKLPDQLRISPPFTSFVIDNF